MVCYSVFLLVCPCDQTVWSNHQFWHLEWFHGIFDNPKRWTFLVRVILFSARSPYSTLWIAWLYRRCCLSKGQCSYSLTFDKNQGEVDLIGERAQEHFCWLQREINIRYLVLDKKAPFVIPFLLLRLSYFEVYHRGYFLCHPRE